MSRYRFIFSESAIWSVRLMCRVLEVARSAYYSWLGTRTCARITEDLKLSVHVKAIHLRSRKTYGSPRVLAELRSEGHVHVGRRRIARIMREQGLSGTPKRRFKGSTTDSDHSDPIAPNVLQRNFVAACPNTVWVGDITYLRTVKGWVYLAVLIDLYSRKVVGWALDTHMKKELCLEALTRAVAVREPKRGLIHHTDRGSQYTSRAYSEALERTGMVPSMSRKGDCWDNAVSESFFGTIEQELVGQSKIWADVTEARAAVSHYIHGFYNASRLHSTLNYQSPVDFENIQEHERKVA